MLDIDLIRNDPDKVRRALLKRSVDADLARILELDKEIRSVTTLLGQRRADRNLLAKENAKSDKEAGLSSEAQNKAIQLKSEIAEIEASLAKLQADFDDLMSQLPNLPDDRVPAGGKESNVCIRTWGEKLEFKKSALDHVEIATRHRLVDFERGVKLGGSGFWMYTGQGAALEWALLNYFCQKHHEDGYTFILPPHLLTPEAGYAAGQFPKFYDDVFHLDVSEGGQPRFLLPTAETALLNIYRDEILREEDLPIKAFAYTPCYRREAGGPRSDERGTIRGHQFNKVEMFQFVAPEDAEAALQELLDRAEKLLQELGLHYRTTLLAAEDASASMAMTYDVEVWLPSLGIYKEVTSVSWAGDYQARRAKIRYKSKDSKKNRLVHTLNASGLATSRLFPAILEQHQQTDGTILVPKPLQKWLGTERIGK